MEQAVIEIKDLRMQYGNGPQVLKGINLEIMPGQIIGYIGPNGAGKSTTVKVMLGLIDEYQGEVRIFDKDIADDPVNYKKRIGYVPEIAEVYENLTGEEYLTFVGEIYGMDYGEARNKAEKMMALFGVEDSFQSVIASYSKGMKQKLLIVASMLHNPDILFLDEPLTGLDANSAMIFKEILAKQAQQGKTIFYSSHIMEVVEKISDRILVLNDGHIVADGTFDELKSQSKEGTLAEIFNEMTGFTSHSEVADQFIDTICEVMK